MPLVSTKTFVHGAINSHTTSLKTFLETRVVHLKVIHSSTKMVLFVLLRVLPSNIAQDCLEYCNSIHAFCTREVGFELFSRDFVPGYFCYFDSNVEFSDVGAQFRIEFDVIESSDDFTMVLGQWFQTKLMVLGQQTQGFNAIWRLAVEYVES